MLHVSTYDIAGGAARAAHRLHTGLRRAGVDSRMYVKERQVADDAITACDRSFTLPQRGWRYLKARRMKRRLAAYDATRPAGHAGFTQARVLDGKRVVRQLPDADIYNLHWINRFVDPLLFFGSVGKPAVWTLHDMNPFTGGCHYDDGCSRFTDRCGACPQLGSADASDLSRANWERKAAAYAGANVQVVCPSRWLAEEARRSSLLGRFDITVVPHGVDTAEYAPRDAAAARPALGIPSGARVVLFAADSTRDTRKGLHLLLDVLQGLAGSLDELFLLSMGRGGTDLHIPVPHVHLGALGVDRMLALAYNLADVFVLPSRQDNLPNTVLESMACGTAVVAFDTGGVPDMVRPQETGLLAPRGDGPALGEAMRYMLTHDHERNRMGRQARAVVEREYTLELQANRYRSLYEKRLIDVR